MSTMMCVRCIQLSCFILTPRCRAARCTLEPDVFLRTTLELYLFNELPRCLRCGDGTQSETGVAHCGFVSSRSKTDVVLVSCHKRLHQPTCEETQAEPNAFFGMQHT